MRKQCAVPKCETGNKFTGQTYVFKAPRDIEQLKKWQVAIPGIELKKSQYVCEKHFKEVYIRREWIKRDNDSRIIAEVPYKHPRLTKSAIPTIFNSPTMEQVPQNVKKSVKCRMRFSVARVSRYMTRNNC